MFLIPRLGLCHILVSTLSVEMWAKTSFVFTQADKDSLINHMRQKYCTLPFLLLKMTLLHFCEWQ